MLEDLQIYTKAYAECLAEGISTIRKRIQDLSVSVLYAHSAPSETVTSKNKITSIKPTKLEW